MGLSCVAETHSTHTSRAEHPLIVARNALSALITTTQTTAVARLAHSTYTHLEKDGDAAVYDGRHRARRQKATGRRTHAHFKQLQPQSETRHTLSTRSHTDIPQATNESATHVVDDGVDRFFHLRFVRPADTLQRGVRYCVDCCLHIVEHRLCKAPHRVQGAHHAAFAPRSRVIV